MPSTISMNEYIGLVNSSLKVIADKENVNWQITEIINSQVIVLKRGVGQGWS